ncbi:uncharacterized protein LOC114361234 [Ostrinia furnacalis]|uniref:uncharacterized protein LOC114361234 n=1 Tax=Ostrinia furnacalis TaxID=93504 RepID=UPI00103A8CB3|nr:uncharacterized protein LOC114361234 [Ostrinia furnacalis]
MTLDQETKTLQLARASGPTRKPKHYSWPGREAPSTRKPKHYSWPGRQARPGNQSLGNMARCAKLKPRLLQPVTSNPTTTITADPGMQPCDQETKALQLARGEAPSTRKPKHCSWPGVRPRRPGNQNITAGPG